MPVDLPRSFGEPARQSAPQQGRANNNNRNRDPNFVVSEYWCNIGYETTIQSANRRTGELESFPWFIQLGGIPLDSFKELSISNESEAKNIAAGKTNKLYNQVMQLARELTPGQTIVLPGRIGGVFQIQLRRKNEEKFEQAAMQQQPGEDFSFSLKDLLAAKQAAE